MATDWSETIVVADLQDEPTFSEEVSSLTSELDRRDERLDVVLNFSDVSYVNSSNIAQLLRLRKSVVEHGGRLKLAGVHDTVWSVMILTGLDKVFEFASDKATAIAAVQLEKGG
jgi:anti-sigma B factor antagonist